jgi:hypothetical protein
MSLRFALRSLAIAVALAAVVGLSLPAADATFARKPSATNQGATGYRELMGVSNVSPTDAWAVGRHVQFGGADWSPVILHWDGSGWTRVDGPDPGPRAELSGVSAIASDDAWAVGSYESAGGQLTLTEHWDGTRWSQVSSPSPGLSQSWLNGVSTVSDHLAWAVGAYVVRHPLGPRRVRTVIERWDGESWALVPSPNPGIPMSQLLGVSGDSRGDAWAVGSYTVAPRSGRVATLALHWDGTGWSQVETPNPGGHQDVFTAVAATSSAHAWAVGAYRGAGKGRQTLIAHWNGSTWTQAWSPNPGPTENHLFGVSATSPTDIWAVGEYVPTRGTGGERQLTLIAHFVRGGWTQVQAPPAGYPVSVSADSSSDAWAVGDGNLFLHWNGVRWSKSKRPGHLPA